MKNEIKGLFIEYDDHFKNYLISENQIKNVMAKVDLRLNVLEDYDGDGQMDEGDIETLLRIYLEQFLLKLNS